MKIPSTKNHNLVLEIWDFRALSGKTNRFQANQ